MLKKITLAMLAVSVSASALYAAPTHNSLQSEINQLKADIAALQTNNQSMMNKLQISHVGNTAVGKSQGIPTKGEFIRSLHSDMERGITATGEMSSSKFAASLLKRRNSFSDVSLTVGGYVEADAQYWFGDTILTKSGTAGSPSVDSYQQGGAGFVDTGDLYITANVGHYVTTQLTFAADEATNPYILDAFVIFGNLETSPYYLTVGKNRLSVGNFSGGGAWSNSLTSDYFRPGRHANVGVGFHKDGFDSVLDVYQKDTNHTSFSYGAWYSGSHGKLNYSVNGGYTHNWKGDISAINGNKRIGAVNFDGGLGYGMFHVGAGYAQTAQKFNVYLHKPKQDYAGAYYATLDVSPMIAGRSTDFGFAYNGTYNFNDFTGGLSGGGVSGATTSKVVAGAYDSSGQGMKRQLTFSISRAVFSDNVLLSSEYAAQELYTGKKTNTVTVDLSVYF